MSKANQKTLRIRDFILRELAENPKHIIHSVQQAFSVSRQTAHRHIKALVDNGDVIAQGETRSRVYSLATRFSQSFDIDIDGDTEEHVIWEEQIRPTIADLKQNVLEICHHGLTEMLNNVIDHSESATAQISVRRTAVDATLRVSDKGIGIFEKIQREFGLHDQRHALLELSKGKLTTDADNHSGEGIFFTSRMFDKFVIRSSKMAYVFTTKLDDDLFFETSDKVHIDGTHIFMCISFHSNRNITSVFDQYTTGDDDHQFSRTHVPVNLASYAEDQLVSRSAAKRVLARFNSFKEVWLDFQGVERIGQAFADEIFRVYAKAHPEIAITFTNANPDVEKMILRAIGKLHEELAYLKQP